MPNRNRKRKHLMNNSYIYIESSGYDPEAGKKAHDPYLGKIPTLGACMPNIRSQITPGNHIFFISGKIANHQQYIIGGFQVEEKIHATEAYNRFPQHRLLQTTNKEIIGNIIIDAQGNQHRLDKHTPKTFQNRIQNYIVGCNPITLTSPNEIAIARKETLYVLQNLFKKSGTTPFDIVARWRKLDRIQTKELLNWLSLTKNEIRIAA
jgi:hypothetical protein